MLLPANQERSESEECKRQINKAKIVKSSVNSRHQNSKCKIRVLTNSSVFASVGSKTDRV